MQWADKLGSLKRRLKLAARVAKAEMPLLRPLAAPPAPRSGRITEWPAFGHNPGRLRMFVHAPDGAVRSGRPLIVLLHGCGQAASGFAEASGWVRLADRLGVPLVLPEQAEGNNSGRCFRWFQSAETMRDHGEAASIAAMTRAAMARYESDPRRVFVVGLSAGGAMAASILAGYPDLFAAGAVVAGLPVGAAEGALQGLLRMTSMGPERQPAEWADQVRRLAPAGYAGAWPRLSIWHGGADETVIPDNGALLAMQWRALHGLQDLPTRDETLSRGRHRAWADSVELWTLTDMGHGYPVGAGVGTPAPFMLDRGLPATLHIAEFWRLN